MSKPIRDKDQDEDLYIVKKIKNLKINKIYLLSLDYFMYTGDISLKMLTYKKCSLEFGC
jgi:hypothetical protein